MKPTTTFILSVFLLLTTSCHNNNQPIIHTIHDTVLKFIPHRAPDSAYLGKYEGMKGPFMMPKSPGSKDSLLIEDMEWAIDSNCHKYRSRASGYLHEKDKNGKIIDIPITIMDDQNYDTLKTHLPAHHHLPVAAPPVAKKLPDSVHAPSASAEQEAKALWKKLRHVNLPYTYMANDQLQLTILTRKVSTETSHDTIYLNTFLTARAKFINSKAPAEPITMQETEPVE